MLVLALAVWLLLLPSTGRAVDTLRDEARLAMVSLRLVYALCQKSLCGRVAARFKLLVSDEKKVQGSRSKGRIEVKRALLEFGHLSACLPAHHPKSLSH